jgi:hypothetical protein
MQRFLRSNKLIRDKWLNINKEVAWRKIMKVTNITHIQNVEKYLVYLKINGLVK